MSVKGIVLGGGRSSRFGEDKAMATAGGLTLVERCVGFLRELRLGPVVITNSFKDYSFLSCPIIRDVIPEKGPLGGLYTAMFAFQKSALLVLTCDMPALTLSSLEALLEAHREENKVTVYERDGSEIQPFPGIYEASLSRSALTRLNARQLSMEEFLESIPEKKVLQSGQVRDIFVNVNEKRDLEDFVRRV